MDTDFGIAFYLCFDCFSGTTSQRHSPFNWTGYETAKQRYLLEDDGEDEEGELAS